MSPRILLAEDPPLYLEAVQERLRRLLPDAELLLAARLDDAISMAQGRETGLDLVLLDYNMPGIDDADGVSKAIDSMPSVPIAIMSGIATPEEVQRVIKAGARGFLPKSMSSNQFNAAITLLLSGGTYLPTDILTSLMTDTAAAQKEETAFDAKARELGETLGSLTGRELEVMKRLTVGWSNKEIGRELNLAEITVKLHVRQILKKLHLRNRSEAAALGTRAGLV